jgi:hypothetical protein
VRDKFAAWRLPGVWLLAAMFGSASAQAEQNPSCEIHVYPASGVHSVGEDFDAAHAIDQDLSTYERAAGRPLNWLTPERQLAILAELDIGSLVGVTKSVTLHPEPLTRLQALKPGTRTPADGCAYEIILPQIMLERSGLASRSLRLFGVVRIYQSGSLVRGYTGFAGASLVGIHLKSPADTNAATVMVEQAYRNAVKALLRNSLGNSKTKTSS